MLNLPKPVYAFAVVLICSACMSPGIVRVPNPSPAHIERMERRGSLAQADFRPERTNMLPQRVERVVTGQGAWAVDEAYVILRPTVDAPAVWSLQTASALASVGLGRNRIRQASAAGSGARIELHVYRFVARGGGACEPLVASFDEVPSFADAGFGKLGCANEANLRAMVANPRDLQGHAARPLNHGSRAAWPVDRYLSAPTASQ